MIIRTFDEARARVTTVLKKPTLRSGLAGRRRFAVTLDHSPDPQPVDDLVVLVARDGAVTQEPYSDIKAELSKMRDVSASS